MKVVVENTEYGYQKPSPPQRIREPLAVAANQTSRYITGASFVDVCRISLMIDQKKWDTG